MPPSNNSHTIGSSEQNKNRPRIVAMASIHSTHTHVEIISDNGHQASGKAICVVRVVSTAASRTERLCVLQTASSDCYSLTRAYLMKPSLMSVGFPKK